MQKEFSPFRIAVYALCALSLFGSRAYGQEKKDEVRAHPNGIVQDWSHRAAVYPRVGPVQSLIKLQNDPRAIQSWQESARKDWWRWRGRPQRAPKSGLIRDWNVSLSAFATSVIPAGTYPAKYGFNPSAAPSCTADYVAFPVNAGLAPASITGTLAASTTVTVTAGTVTAAYVGQPIFGTGIPTGDTVASITGSPATSLTLTIAATGTGSETLNIAGQPNLVILNNLYRGASSGLCNATPTATDDGVSATVDASYFLNGVGGQVSTSPALSSDGTKIAVIQSAPGVRAIFEVLAPNFGSDGVDPTNAQDALLPVSPNFTTAAPGPGNVEAIAMGPAGANSDTNSSPFILYAQDEAYVGDDAGVLYRIINVFCTSAACQASSVGAMKLDPTWGTSGALTTGCAGALASPVVDFNTGNVFVGCTDGKLYGFTSAGAALTGSPMAIGDGSATGGIVAPPLVDVVNGFIYVVSGNNGTDAVLAQIQDSGTTITLKSTANFGVGGVGSLQTPAFNEAYFTDPTSTNWLLFESTGNSNTTTSLWGITFGAGHAMTAGTPANNLVTPGAGPLLASPITTFFNGTTDFLFLGTTSTFTGDSVVSHYVITGNTFPTVDDPSALSEGAGTTGIVVDNNDIVDGQTSSIYFGVLGTAADGPNANSAVKLTQAALQ